MLFRSRSQGKAYLVILCFERQCPKENTFARLKSKDLGPPKKITLAAPLYYSQNEVLKDFGRARLVLGKSSPTMCLFLFRRIWRTLWRSASTVQLLSDWPSFNFQLLTYSFSCFLTCYFCSKILIRNDEAVCHNKVLHERRRKNADILSAVFLPKHFNLSTFICLKTSWNFVCNANRWRTSLALILVTLWKTIMQFSRFSFWSFSGISLVLDSQMKNFFTLLMWYGTLMVAHDQVKRFSLNSLSVPLAPLCTEQVERAISIL